MWAKFKPIILKNQNFFNLWDTTSEGRLGMDYSSLGVVMGISLAKELSRFESDTDRRIRLLEEENEELRKEVEQLKSV